MEDEERALYEKLNSLTELVVDNAGFQKLADFISDMYAAPVSIIDNAYTVIAFSQHRIPRDKVIAKELQSGHLGLRPSSMMQMGESSGPRHRVTSTVRIEVPNSNGQLHNYLTRIYIHHVDVASFSVFAENGKLTRTQERFLPRIGTVLALELQKSSFFTLNKSRYFTHLLASVLDTDAAESLVDIKERFALFGHTILPFMRVALIDTQNTLFAEDELRALSASVHETLPNNVYVVRDSSIMFLVSQNDDSPFSPDIVRKLTMLLDKSNTRMGVSGPYTAIEQTRKRHDQAQSAIDTARKVGAAGFVTHFDDVCICDMLRRAAQTTDLRPYLYPPFTKLIDYDAQHETELTKTLLTHLNSPHEQMQTCDRLHIHRNTLYYRLKQIKEISGIAADDGQEAAKILISAQILGLTSNSWDLVKPF